MAKSKWEDVKEKLVLVEGWARDGLSEEQIARNLGISKATLENYKRDHVDFLASIKKGREVSDYEVIGSLYKTANGFSYDEVTREPLYNAVTGDPILDENGEHKIAVTKIVTKMVLPNTTAQIFWLKNRRSKDWKDRQEMDLNQNVVQIKVTPPAFGDDE